MSHHSVYPFYRRIFVADGTRIEIHVQNLINNENYNKNNDINS